MGFLHKLNLLFSEEEPTKYGVLNKTLNGENVRSKSEKRIADYLYQNNIDYKYEKPLRLNGTRGKKLTFMPDFYLPKYEVYIEYFGGWDLSDYQKTACWKMKKFYDNDIKFIPIFPNGLNNIHWSIKKNISKLTGKEVR